MISERVQICTLWKLFITHPCSNWRNFEDITLFYAFLGIKKQVADMILSYNSLWLRIGLEV